MAFILQRLATSNEGSSENLWITASRWATDHILLQIILNLESFVLLFTLLKGNRFRTGESRRVHPPDGENLSY